MRWPRCRLPPSPSVLKMAASELTVYLASVPLSVSRLSTPFARLMKLPLATRSELAVYDSALLSTLANCALVMVAVGLKVSSGKPLTIFSKVATLI